MGDRIGIADFCPSSVPFGLCVTPFLFTKGRSKVILEFLILNNSVLVGTGKTQKKLEEQL